MEVLSLFGHCHVKFLCMDTLSFFGNSAKNGIVFCFLESFDQKTTEQTDGSCKVTIDSQLLNNLLKKQSLFSTNTDAKCPASKKNCIARHDDKMCFLPNCRKHSILIGDIKELLRCLLFQLPTRGLFLYTFRVPIQWQSVCQEVTIF